MKSLTLALAGSLLAATAATADHLALQINGGSYSRNTITFPSVMMDKPGYLVVHETRNGAPVVPASAGHVWLPAGTSTNVKVKVQGRVTKDADYVAMLHYETNGNRSYEFRDGMTDVDGPATGADGAPYVKPFRTAM